MRRLAILSLLLVPLHVAASGTLSVSQTAATGGSVPKGAQRVPFLRVTAAASCDADAAIRELTLVHSGLGDSSDLARVYATDGKRRLTRARPIDASDRTVTLRFVPALSVAACGSAVFDVVADLSPDAASAGEHRLSVELPTDVVTDGASVRLSSVALPGTAVVRPKATGTVSVTVEGPNTPLRYGTNRVLARVRLEADGEADQTVSSITLTNRGKATDGDLKNLRLENRTGTRLTGVAPTLDGDAVTLTFDPPFRLDRNDETLLELKGDALASRRRTVRFVLEEPSDLVAAPRGR